MKIEKTKSLRRGVGFYFWPDWTVGNHIVIFYNEDSSCHMKFNMPTLAGNPVVWEVYSFKSSNK